MENIKDEFRKDFCERCGSQRCSGQDDELEYCERFKNLMDNSGTPMEEIKSKREYDELRMPLDDDDKLATEVTIMGKRILPPDGYLVGKITETDNGMLVEYVEKKPKYPNDYKTCCDALYANSNHNECYEACMRGYPMDTFARLLICRDAYWKIAGEQMGLGKPWEPKYISLEDNTYFTIQTFNGEIDKSGTSHRNAILAFPTIEMRDAFYENFKKEIEQCKELL